MDHGASSSAVVELKPGVADDPDGLRTAAMLDAYFRAEHTRAFRRRLWDVIGILVSLWALVALTTSFLTGRAIVAGFGVAAAIGTWAAFVEWRASERLSRLMAQR